MAMQQTKQKTNKQTNKQTQFRKQKQQNTKKKEPNSHSVMLAPTHIYIYTLYNHSSNQIEPLG